MQRAQPHRRLRAASVPVAVALGTWLHPLGAAEWSVEPRLNAYGEVNTNKRLTTDDHDTVFGLIGEVGAVLQRATEINTLYFEPLLRTNRYWGEEDLDHDDYSLKFGANHRLERVVLGLIAEYRRDSTLATELETTGFVQNQLAVDSVNIGPSLRYLITERDSVDFGYSYNQVSYEDAPGSGLSDYTYKTADITFTHDLTEREQVFAQFAYSRFDVEDITGDPFDPLNLTDSGSSTDSYTALAGFQGQTETLRGSASGGIIYSTAESEDFFGQEQTFSGTGSLFNFTVDKQFSEKTTANGAYRRSVDPSGDGRQNVRDEWTAGLLHQFTERLTGNLAFRHLQTTTQFSERFGGGDATRTYLSGDAGLRYMLDPWWSLFLRYNYAQQSFESDDDTAVANQVQAGVSYSGRKWSVSR